MRVSSGGLVENEIYRTWKRCYLTVNKQKTPRIVKNSHIILTTFACERREGNYEPYLALADKCKQKRKLFLKKAKHSFDRKIHVILFDLILLER